ncbi:MAG: hypothetical protein LBK44_01980, partial [Spirochaetales bacterium]|nr:hypothetical protein [Spirochaetales bacterium]
NGLCGKFAEQRLFTFFIILLRKIAWFATKHSALRAVHVAITSGCRSAAQNQFPELPWQFRGS